MDAGSVGGSGLGEADAPLRGDQPGGDGAAVSSGQQRRDRAPRAIGAVVDLADGDQVCWATDLNAGGAALLITLLAAHSQRLLYIPGRVVHHAAATYQGAGRPTPRTPGSSPTRRECAPTCSRFARRTKSASICGCSPHVVPIWSATGFARSTGFVPRCWSTFLLWNGPSTTPRTKPP